MIKRFFEGFFDDFSEKIMIGFAFSILLGMIIGGIWLISLLTSWVFSVILIAVLLIIIIVGHIIVKYLL